MSKKTIYETSYNFVWGFQQVLESLHNEPWEQAVDDIQRSLKTLRNMAGFYDLFVWMFLGTKRFIRGKVDKVFDTIMEVPVSEPEWKERFCRIILEGKLKDLPRMVIPPPEIKPDDIDGDFLRPTAELNEWLKVDSLLSDYRNFPESLPRHAVRWLVGLSENPTAIFDEFEHNNSIWV
ncbi:MAG: hypothetical protein V2A65_02425 [Candidatus Omnitrophota bacterium]